MRRRSKNLPAQKYGIGEKVTAPGFEKNIETPDKILEVESAFWNGFTFMYHFKDSQIGLGEPALTLLNHKLDQL